jgi:predicted nucleic acid-binding Zn ribbon protein
MKKKDRDKMMIVYKIVAILILIAMVLGIIFGGP